jgi:hypothetical protein
VLRFIKPQLGISASWQTAVRKGGKALRALASRFKPSKVCPDTSTPKTNVIE